VDTPWSISYVCSDLINDSKAKQALQENEKPTRSLGNDIHTYPVPALGQSITINLSLVKSDNVTISIYDVQGNSVFVMSKFYSSGTQTLMVNTDEWQSGIYTIHLNSQSYSATQVIPFIK
ncbi:MAG: T9SS type A sorting domain-containing protein, partial [Candidatus Kapabacteria bacterium]|nr:T9SS type A sorting domain-containing protein [Candidatus Kapabacteria bacterium]